MASRFQRIQHLYTALSVFETAARKQSFTAAASDLGLRQPTVSQHIANLELDLGVALFERDHNRLKLTEPGKLLSQAIDLGLSHIDAAVRNTAQSQQRSGLTLACSFSFAHGWLLPRFSDLRRAAPHAPIHLVVSYWLDDLDVNNVDMIVNWRSRGWTDWPRIELFDEITYPVCAPEYLEKNPALSAAMEEPSILTQANLLNYHERPNEFVSWEQWFRNWDVPYSTPADKYRFSNYHFMIHSALDGEGVALGWHHLVADQIAENKLVQLAPSTRHSGTSYALESRADRGDPEHRQAIIEWFKEEVALFLEESI